MTKTTRAWCESWLSSGRTGAESCEAGGRDGMCLSQTRFAGKAGASRAEGVLVVDLRGGRTMFQHVAAHSLTGEDPDEPGGGKPLVLAIDVRNSSRAPWRRDLVTRSPGSASPSNRMPKPTLSLLAPVSTGFSSPASVLLRASPICPPSRFNIAEPPLTGDSSPAASRRRSLARSADRCTTGESSGAVRGSLCASGGSSVIRERSLL